MTRRLELNNMWWVYLIFFIILFLLLAGSAVFSFSEMALANTSKIKIQSLQKENKKLKKKCAKVIVLLENYNKTITTIVVCNNIFNILATTISTSLFAALLPGPLGAALSFLLMTIFIVVFCETLPKMLAKKYPEEGSIKFAGMLTVNNKIFYPVVLPLIKMVPQQEDVTLASDEEINLAIEEAKQAGVTTPFEQNLIKRSLQIDKETIEKFVIPKSQVITIPVKITKKQLDKLISQNSHSRLPMIDEKGEIVKIFSTKQYILDRMTNVNKPVDNYTIGFTKIELGDNPFHAFVELRNNRQKIAIVLDNKGKYVGIITIEDIVEQILGNIYDEDDVEKDGVYKISGTSYLLEPEVKLSYFVKTYEPKMKVKSKHSRKTVAEWLKSEIVSEPKVGEYYTHNNIMIWIKEDPNDKENIIYEIDII